MQADMEGGRGYEPADRLLRKTEFSRDSYIEQMERYLQTGGKRFGRYTIGYFHVDWAEADGGTLGRNRPLLGALRVSGSLVYGSLLGQQQISVCQNRGPMRKARCSPRGGAHWWWGQLILD